MEFNCRLQAVLDEFTRECLAIDVARRITSDEVLGRLASAGGHLLTHLRDSHHTACVGRVASGQPQRGL